MIVGTRVIFFPAKPSERGSYRIDTTNDLPLSLYSSGPSCFPLFTYLTYFPRTTFFQSPPTPCLLGPLTFSDVYHPFHRRCHKENVAKWGLGTRKCQKKKRKRKKTCVLQVVARGGYSLPVWMDITLINKSQGSHLPG